MRFVYLNGDIREVEASSISVLEPGLLLGVGLFETVRAYRGRLFHAGDHWARLSTGAEEIELNLPASPDELTDIGHDLLAKNEVEEAAVRVSLYLGTDRDHVAVHLRSDWHYPADLYEKGAKVVVGRHVLNEKTPTAPLKTTSRLLNYLTDREAKAAGALEGLFRNTEGQVTEGSRSNVFWVKDGVLLTPSLSTGCLAGVTRRIVIELAQGEGIQVRQVKEGAEALHQADEVFLSSTLLEVMPVSLVGDHTVGSGRPGPVTKTLGAAFRALVDKEIGRA